MKHLFRFDRDITYATLTIEIESDSTDDDALRALALSQAHEASDDEWTCHEGGMDITLSEHYTEEDQL